MKKSTLLLKGAVVLMSLPTLGLAILLWLSLGSEAFTSALLGETLGYTILGLLFGLTLSIVPYFFALAQSFHLPTYIDHGQSFSNLSVRALQKIKRCAFVISGIYVITLPLVAIIAEWDDASGLMVVAVVPIFASLVIALFSALLQNLLSEAIEIKNENQLTI